jgi:ABC-type uncharacterized transport system substrate-binding protein
VARRVKLLKTVVPPVTRAGFLANLDNPAIPGILRMTRSAAEALGIEIIPIDVRSDSDVEAAFQTMIAKGVHGFIFYPIPLQDTRMPNSQRPRYNTAFPGWTRSRGTPR